MGCADHDHDLIQDLSKCLDALWRFDQYIANAEGRPSIQALWRKLENQEQDTVKELKTLIAGEFKAK